MFDFLLVGSGLFNAVFAYEATKRGKKCLVLEVRDHIGGNVYTENIHGIQGAVAEAQETAAVPFICLPVATKP